MNSITTTIIVIVAIGVALNTLKAYLKATSFNVTSVTAVPRTPHAYWVILNDKLMTMYRSAEEWYFDQTRDVKAGPGIQAAINNWLENNEIEE